MLPLIYLLFVSWAFWYQIRSLARGKHSKRKSIFLHAVYTSAPVLLYVGVFAALVGIEELTELAIIGEGFARSLALVVVGGVGVTIMSTLVFTLTVLVMRSGNSDHLDSPEDM